MEVSFTSVYCDFLSPYIGKVPFLARFFGVIWIKISSSRGSKWYFKRHGSHKLFVEFHGSRSLVIFADVCEVVSRARELVSRSRLRKSQSTEVLLETESLTLEFRTLWTWRARSLHWRGRNVLGSQKNASLGFSQSRIYHSPQITKIQGTVESSLVRVSSAPLMHHEPEWSWITNPDPNHPKESHRHL